MTFFFFLSSLIHSSIEKLSIFHFLLLQVLFGTCTFGHSAFLSSGSWFLVRFIYSTLMNYLTATFKPNRIHSKEMQSFKIYNNKHQHFNWYGQIDFVRLTLSDWLFQIEFVRLTSLDWQNVRSPYDLCYCTVWLLLQTLGIPEVVKSIRSNGVLYPSKNLDQHKDTFIWFFLNHDNPWWWDKTVFKSICNKSQYKDATFMQQLKQLFNP